ncbi:MAG: hypothetical protein M1828_003245 [Chrysothrix sp. TS-e1954]|nr:MAG: hypothetical protein M1828_003245 [Chrysothrix sp. TS-e1954]
MSGRQGPLKSNIAHQRIERIAAESGLRINTDGLIGHTRRAHRLVWYVRRVMPGKEAEVVERLFRLFWGEGGDVTSRGQLARVAGMVGLELEEVEGWLGGDEGADEVDGEAEEWIRERESGEKRGVPFSVVVSVEDDGAERRVVVGESKSVEQWSEILRDVMAG